MSLKKMQLGQFFTVNYVKILEGIKIPESVKHIIEPFAGNGDLVKFVKNSNLQNYELECYDIDVCHPFITQRDTLRNPPVYTGKFVITNPPYLARNKSVVKDLFEKFQVNDLYKCFMKQIIVDPPLGGILIIPLNFWSSVRIADVQLRREFLETFYVKRLNIFEERVFSDTSSTICSLDFAIRNRRYNGMVKIPTVVFPAKREMSLEFSQQNGFIIGGDMYKLEIPEGYTITRITRVTPDHLQRTNIKVRCLDDGGDAKISASLVDSDKIYIDNTPNLSARSFLTLVIDPPLSLKQQDVLVEKFNQYLSKKRDEYHSLFLPNYRESKNSSRKRIPFDLVYRIMGNLLDHQELN